MRAYAYKVAANADGGPYRLNPGEDAVWPPAVRAYGGPEETGNQKKLAIIGKGALRLFVPVSLLLVLLGAAYLYADALFALHGALIRDAGLAMSDLVLPGTWYCLHLTNRRYGPAYAFAQLLAALVISLVVVLINPGDMDNWVITITGRGILSFGGAFLVANFAGITFFDAARGPRWWTAPLAGSLAAALVFSAIFYPAAYAGMNERWSILALIHCLVFIGMSVLLLGPYWLLRPATRPLNGRNGY